jgi:hypothetical protein
VVAVERWAQAVPEAPQVLASQERREPQQEAPVVVVVPVVVEVEVA